MILDSTNKSLQFVLAGSVAANQLSSVAAWADMSGSTFTPGSTTAQTNNTTSVTMVASPAASTQRQIKTIDIYNPDTAAATVSVVYNDNSTLRTLVKITLQPGETLQFAENAWSVIDNAGRAQVADVGSGTLAGDSDVNLSSPTNGQVLTYQSSSSKWVNAAATGGGSGGAWQFSVESYGALGDGKIVNVGTTNGSRNITATSGTWASGDVGKSIMINGGIGSTNIPLISTIASFTNSGAVTLAAGGPAASVTSSALPAIFGTDDTSSIRNAIDAAKTYALAHENYSEVLFKDKYYILAAAPQQTSSPFYNTQLKIPTTTTDSDHKITTAFIGAGKNDHLQYWGSTVPGLLGTCLVSMQTAPSTVDATYGPQSVLGGPTGSGGFPTFGGIGSFPNAKAVIENISVVSPAYTNMTAIDLSWMAGCYMDGSSAQIFAQPLSGNGALLNSMLSDSTFQSRLGAGLRTPGVGNNADVTIPSFACEGYTVGVYASEHVWFGNLKTIYNDIALHITTYGITAPGHGVAISRWTAEAYNGGISTNSVGSGATCPFYVNLATEFSGSSYDISDPDNALRGEIHIWAGVDNRAPVVSGAAYVTIHNDTVNSTQLGGSIIPRVVSLTDGSSISVDALRGNDYRVTLGGNRTLSSPTNPSDGQRLTFQVGQDGTGSRTLAYSAAYDFGTAGAPTLSTAAGSVDVLQFVFNTAKNKWFYLGTGFGFAPGGGGGSAQTLFGQPSAPATLNSDTSSYTMGMQFSLSSSKTLTGIWFYSPSGASGLPSGCAIYDVSGTSIVSGASNTSPSWSGGAGTGWVKCSFGGSVTLSASTNYKVVVQKASTGTWYGSTSHYWDTGAGASGLTSGAITAPNNAGASGGQDTFVTPSGALTYPSSSFNATNYWVDVEVS